MPHPSKLFNCSCQHTIQTSNLDLHSQSKADETTQPQTTEFKLIIKLLQQDATKCTLIHEKDYQDINWDYLLQLTIRHRVIPQVFKHLKDINTVPSKFVEDLKHLNYKIKMQNLNIVGEIIRITKFLTTNNIPYLIVKGAPLAQLVYQDCTIRQAKDIDLLVDLAYLDLAQQLITQLGYTTTRPTYSLAGFKKSYYLAHRHDIALYNQQRQVEVELHFNLNYLGLPFFKLAEIPKKTIRLNHHHISIPSNEYHLLYLMLHAAIHAYSRIRWLHDIVLFLENTAVDINNVFSLSKTLKVEHIALQTLLLIKNLYPINNIEINLITSKIKPRLSHLLFPRQLESIKIKKPAHRLKPEDNIHFPHDIAKQNKQVTYLAKVAFKFITTDYELSNKNSAWNKMFLLYRLYLVRLAIKDKKFKAIFGDLIKIDKIFPYVTMHKYMSFGYYILYPIMVVKYLISRRF